MSLLSNFSTKARNIQLTTTIGLNKRKDTRDASTDDSLVAAVTQTSVAEVTLAEVADDSQVAVVTQTSVAEVTLAEVADDSQVAAVTQTQEHGQTTETLVTEATIMKMISQLEMPYHPEFNLLKSLPRMPSLRRDTSLFGSETTVTKEGVGSPPLDTPLESVYLVLRPLKLAEAPEKALKKLGAVVSAVEFENFLVLQHWGVLIGDRYYHLHADDDKRLSVSLFPFIDAKKLQSRHTIKIAIWRTSLSHEERVGIAVGIIKAMGGFKAESEVEITDENGNIITDPEDRKRFTMEGRYIRTPFARISKGKYHAVANNCINFTATYVLQQLLLHIGGVGVLASNIQWIVKKWIEMGCKKSPRELAGHLAGIFGVPNLFSFSPTNSAKVLIKLLSIFLDIDYNPVLDGEPSQKLTSNEASTSVAIEGNVGA